MLSVLFSTSDLHSSRWQSGRVHGIKEDLLSPSVAFVLLSCPRVCLLDVSRLLGLTLASIRSCLLLPPGFLDTREAGSCAGSRVFFVLLSLLVWFRT